MVLTGRGCIDRSSTCKYFGDELDLASSRRHLVANLRARLTVAHAAWTADVR